MTTRLIVSVLAAAAILLAADKVTFSENIAPIVYENCVTCHRQGEAAPFSLISYEDVKKRGALIATVTKARYMPPWHATHGYGDFGDERRLTDQQIATIADWVQQGMPQGDPARMPTLPEFTEGWHLGQPDLILEMPVGYPLPASGPDVFRNFVIPTGLKEDKWVRAVEFRPSTRKAAHHALFAYVGGGSVARLDGVDGKPGFGGMGTVGVTPGQTNSGGLGGWAVGGTPQFLPAGLAMALPKGSDFLLQMHFHLTGKPEVEKAVVGLYFADKAPERNLMSVGAPGLFGFGSGIDIAPGQKDFAIRDSFTIPVDMKAYSAVAHAHYLAREMKATATLPDGTTKPLIWIPDWDFNWQETYNYKEPFLLPKGTRIDVNVTYDNSPDNPRNPSNPPKRVLFGEESFDEMGSVGLLVTTVRKEDESVLQKAVNAQAQAAVQRGVQDGTAKRWLEHQAVRRPAIRTQMTFFDRQGKSSGTVAESGVYSQAALSPDGTRVAVIRNNQGTSEVWVFDVATGNGTPVTSDASPASSPVWSPDGREIVYVSKQNELYRKASDGSGALLYRHTPGTAIFPTDWSVNGQLCFWAGDVIYGLPLNSDRKPVALVSGFNARGGRFSPDGNYLAYSANMGGGFAVYVMSLKDPASKPLQVSKAPALGGIFWREDGKELYFMALTGLAPTGVMAVDLTPGSDAQVGIPRLLFRPNGVNSPAQLSNIASRDGQRFLFLPVAP